MLQVNFLHFEWVWIVFGLSSSHRIWKLKGKRVKKTKSNVCMIDELQSPTLQWISRVFSLKLFLQFSQVMWVFIVWVRKERKRIEFQLSMDFDSPSWVNQVMSKSRDTSNTSVVLMCSSCGLSQVAIVVSQSQNPMFFTVLHQTNTIPITFNPKKIQVNNWIKYNQIWHVINANIQELKITTLQAPCPWTHQQRYWTETV